MKTGLELDFIFIGGQNLKLNLSANILGIRLESHEYCQECTIIYKSLLGNTAWSLEISYESDKKMPNPV